MYAAELPSRTRTWSASSADWVDGPLDETVLAITADRPGLDDGRASAGKAPRCSAMKFSTCPDPPWTRGPTSVRVTDQVALPTSRRRWSTPSDSTSCWTATWRRSPSLNGSTAARGHLTAYGEQIEYDNAGCAAIASRPRSSAWFGRRLESHLPPPHAGAQRALPHRHRPTEARRTERFPGRVPPPDGRSRRAEPMGAGAVPEVSQRTNGAPDLSSLEYSGAEQGRARGTGPAPNTATSSPMSGTPRGGLRADPRPG